MSNLYTGNLMFDAEYYLANNPDLVEAGVTLETAGDHYAQYGAAETLAGVDGRVGPNAWFNIQDYAELNPDLAALLEDEDSGFTAGDLLAHFSTYGAAEGRSPNKEFSFDAEFIPASLYLEYALANEDLLEAFGIAADATRLTDEQQANIAYQFFAYGVNEEREGGIAELFKEPVTVQEAVAAYSDAKAATVAADGKVAEAETVVEEAEVAVEEAEGVTDAALAKVKVAGGNLLPSNFDERPADEQASLILNAQTNLETQVVVANAAANATPALQQATKGGVVASKATGDLTAAKDALTAEQKVFVGTSAFASAGVAVSSVTDSPLKDYLVANEVAASAKVFITANGDEFTLAIGSSAATATEILTAIDGGKVEIAPGQGGNEGIAALQAAAQNVYTAQLAQAAAEAAMVTAGLEAAAAAGALFIWDASAGASGEAVALTVKQVADIEANASGTLTFNDQNIAFGSVAGSTGVVTGAPTSAASGMSASDVWSGSAYASGTPAAVITVSTTPYGKLKIAQDNAADFDKVVGPWEAAVVAEEKANADLVEANGKLEAAEEAQAAAQQAQAAAKEAVETAAANAGKDVTVVEANEDGDYVATDDADLFVYTAGEAMEITGFDAENDTIFLNGDYTITVLEAGQTIAQAADENVLQIFVQELNGNTVLTVEKDAYSASVSGSEDLTEITVTGVTGDVSFDDGFLTIA